MDYLLMCCFDEKEWEKMPQPQRDRVMNEYRAWEEDLIRSGHYRGGAKLGASSTTTTVRMTGGRPAITDGPFAGDNGRSNGRLFGLRRCAIIAL